MTAAPATDTTLAPLESERLAELETIVERGLVTFVDVGRALAEIREARLYRAMHTTFEAYCKARWKFSASRGRQLIAAAAVASEVQSVTRVTVPTERHARELAPLVKEQGPEAAAQVLERVSAQGEPTVAALHDAVTQAVAPTAAPVLRAVPALEMAKVTAAEWTDITKAVAKLEKVCAKSMKARAEVRRLSALPRGEQPNIWQRRQDAKQIPAPVQDAVAALLDAVAAAGGPAR